MYIKDAKVKLWDFIVGYLSWDERREVALFQYDSEFIKKGLSPAPLMMPLSNKIYDFPSLSRSSTFWGVPGLVADSLPEKYANSLMARWLSKEGIKFSDLNPVERLCYLGVRGMGALEFEPNYNTLPNKKIALKVDELVEIAREIIQNSDNSVTKLNETQEEIFEQLIEVGTSAGGAKAKAIIALREEDGVIKEVLPGQRESFKSLSYWIMKFSGVENSEHLSDQNSGRVEYAYYLMAKKAGIKMMESRLYEIGEQAHFMTKRFDRINGYKIHIQSFCSIAHQDRNPVGNTSYEILFSTARELGLNQQSLDQLYKRMVFNILARNQDDHSKNHAFMMDVRGQWQLTPAFDITFSYRKESKWIALQQMCCNTKRDNFRKSDLLEAAKAADVKNPQKIIDSVVSALECWDDFGAEAGVPLLQINQIKQLFRRISE